MPLVTSNAYPRLLISRTLTGGHADAEARRSVLTALPCATLVTARKSFANLVSCFGFQAEGSRVQEVVRLKGLGLRKRI